MHWQPTASRSLLMARAALNQQIRTFFSTRGVLEVETPLMCQASGTDLNLTPITALYQPHPRTAFIPHYLQTSPEFAMKRLLAQGSGPIFQLCKAFRNGETGARHNPEFTMLEWYRPGLSLSALMDEVEALVGAALGNGKAEGIAPAQAFQRLSYRNLFQQHLGIDPHSVTLVVLQHKVRDHIDVNIEVLTTRATCLDLLYGHVLEPRLLSPVFIHSYPAEQAALARVEADDTGQPVALRFELVIGGMELANGYDELVDAAEQQKRFATDRAAREQQGLPDTLPDLRFLAALQHGLPQCSGVALGVDRLLMLQTGTATIDEVLAFPITRA
jgi:lysyl-tRNA synthetase class 2